MFLNERWEESWGGCLELVREPTASGASDLRSVVPLANRAVLFETTEASWHGFRRVQLPPQVETSRRSIAVYFYTAARPETERAPSHGTVYYQRPLAENIRAGYTLSEADVREIEILIARRDEQIRFLYQRELKFSRLIESLTGSPSFRIGRVLTWPVRWVRSLRGER